MERRTVSGASESGVPGGVSGGDTGSRVSSSDSTSGSPHEPARETSPAGAGRRAGDDGAPHGDPPAAPEAAEAGADADRAAPSSEPRLEAKGEDEQDERRTEDQLERDLEELAARAEKADEYLELAQRTKADFENYRRRAGREATLAQDRGVIKLAKELLPAIDNLGRAAEAAAAFAAGSPEEAAADAESQLASGIELVHADVLAALARVGIEPFSPAGEQFDPQRHEAVAQHPVEGQAPGTVIEVYQQGFRLGETVLRPARVLVAA
jgi:molecular chaperone GrpE